MTNGKHPVGRDRQAGVPPLTNATDGPALCSYQNK
jgi:hypothetical protein